jgi:hypothetical protein
MQDRDLRTSRIRQHDSRARLVKVGTKLIVFMLLRQ